MIEDCKTELLSEYIDGELEPVARGELEKHIATCGPCRGLVTELRNVVRRGGAFEHGGPHQDLWPGIAARIGVTTAVQKLTIPKQSARRRVSLSVPQLLAAGIAMVSLVGTAGWMGAQLSRSVVDPQAFAMETPGEVETLVSVSVGTRYDEAVAELMATLEREREWLNASTIRVVEENLLIIDGAIARAREALQQDPESEYVRHHLERTVRQKLGLLRRVTQMASRS